MSIGAASSHRKNFDLIHQIELRNVDARVDVRFSRSNVAAAQESQLNRNISAWFLSFTPFAVSLNSIV